MRTSEQEQQHVGAVCGKIQTLSSEGTEKALAGGHRAEAGSDSCFTKLALPAVWGGQCGQE